MQSSVTRDPAGKAGLRAGPLLQLLLLILLALLVLVPLLWLVSTSLKGPAEDIFTSPPALLPLQPSLDAYGRLFRDNPLAVSYTHLRAHET